MTQMLREAGSTAGGQVVQRMLSEVDQMQHYPDRYSASEEARLHALKAIYNRFFHDIPDIWMLDPENKTPHRMLMDGTWEKHWKRALREKKITPLRGEVENMLYVISDYLDKRRNNIWRYVNVSGVKKGDVDEQFFGQLMLWLKDILDGPVDEMLEEKIEKQKAYLYEVLMSMDVFPKQRIHDKSPARKIISKLYDMLESTMEEVRKIQAQQFTLRKFEEISIATKTMIQHFLKGFSHFSPTLRTLDSLKVWDLQDAIKKSDTRFSQLFLLFVQNFHPNGVGVAYEDAKQDEERAVFDPEQFMTCMQDETRKMGLPKNMPAALVEMVPEIFVSAYHLSKVMQLIREASSTLSEQGTIRLFCNAEGRTYFEFLLEHFQSIKNMFVSKMAYFSLKGMGYVQKKVADAGENPSKESEVGQYDRFKESFMDVQVDNAALDSHLSNTEKQIKSFAGKSPEEAEGRRERLYEKIRNEMRKTNQHALADTLEKIAMERMEKAKCVLPFLEEEKKAMPVVSQSEWQASNRRSSQDVISESRMQRIEEKRFFMKDKMRIALERMYVHQASFFTHFFRSDIVEDFIGAFIKILEDGGDLPLHIFYTLLRDFIACVQYANEKTKNAYANEEFYMVASELCLVLTDPGYIGIIFPEGQAEVLKRDLFAIQTQKEQLEEKLISCNATITEQNRKIERQAIGIKESERIIFGLESTVSEKNKEMANLKLSMDRSVEKISELEKYSRKQEEKIESLERASLVEKEKLEKLMAEMDAQESRMDKKIEEQIIQYMRNMDASNGMVHAAAS